MSDWNIADECRRCAMRREREALERINQLVPRICRAIDINIHLRCHMTAFRIAERSALRLRIRRYAERGEVWDFPMTRVAIRASRHMGR